MSLHQARQDYCLAKQSHVSSRESFLQSLGTKDSQHLLCVEKHQALGCAAKQVSGKLGNTSVTKVIFEGEELNDQHAVESALLRVNEAKIRSSELTPFLQEHLLSAFGIYNSTPATHAILAGTYQLPPGITQYTCDLLRHLSTAPIPPDVH